MALASWLLARRAGGRTVLRMEDLDTPRVRAGSAERILEALAWLGLDWDEGPREGGPHAPYTQSERLALYAEAIAELERLGLLYACDCSRKEIQARTREANDASEASDAREASAPHGAEAVYPGTCRDKASTRAFKREPALRLRVPASSHVSFEDGVQGPHEADVTREVGDFVLRRADGLFAYQLAVVVDDWRMEITDVVRGADLVPSTARQLLLGDLLGAPRRRYWHVPMVVLESGERLEKRAFPRSVLQLREAGDRAESIVGVLAEGLGVASDASPTTASRLAAASAWRPRRDAWRVPPALR